jgi:hypothetical protein
MNATPAAAGAARCRRRFLRFFPGGFRDPAYLDWERDYKWATHERWKAALGRAAYRRLLQREDHREIAARAIRVEQQSRHSMVFSCEKMALRDAVRRRHGAARFATGLYSFLHGRGSLERRFTEWVDVVASLPRRQTRVLTWPVVTVFGFIAHPDRHIFLKPTVTRAAARADGFDLTYRPRPSWDTYASLLQFAEILRHDLRDLKPRDMMDLQSFMWVQGSAEYD